MMLCPYGANVTGHIGLVVKSLGHNIIGGECDIMSIRGVREKEVIYIIYVVSSPQQGRHILKP